MYHDHSTGGGLATFLSNTSTVVLYIRIQPRFDSAQQCIGFRYLVYDHPPTQQDTGGTPWYYADPSKVDVIVSRGDLESTVGILVRYYQYETQDDLTGRTWPDGQATDTFEYYDDLRLFEYY